MLVPSIVALDSRKILRSSCDFVQRQHYDAGQSGFLAFWSIDLGLCLDLARGFGSILALALLVLSRPVFPYDHHRKNNL
jgi:hypothetical protein